MTPIATATATTLNIRCDGGDGGGDTNANNSEFVSLTFSDDDDEYNPNTATVGSGGGGIAAIVTLVIDKYNTSTSSNHTTNNNSISPLEVVDALHGLLNVSTSTTTYECPYYPAMRVVKYIPSCSSTTNSSSSTSTSTTMLFALQHALSSTTNTSGVYILRGVSGTTLDEGGFRSVGVDGGYVYSNISSSTSVPSNNNNNPPSPSSFPILINISASSPDSVVAAECADYWNSAIESIMTLDRIRTTSSFTFVNGSSSRLFNVSGAMGLSSQSLGVVAVSSATNTSTTTTTDDDFITVDKSVTDRMKSVIDSDGSDVQNVSAATLWGLWFNSFSISSNATTSSQAEVTTRRNAELRSALLSTEAATVKKHVPIIAWIAFAFAALFLLALIVTIITIIRKLRKSWRAIFLDRFTESARQYSSLMSGLVAEKWHNQNPNNDNSTSSSSKYNINSNKKIADNNDEDEDGYCHQVESNRVYKYKVGPVGEANGSDDAVAEANGEDLMEAAYKAQIAATATNKSKNNKTSENNKSENNQPDDVGADALNNTHLLQQGSSTSHADTRTHAQKTAAGAIVQFELDAYQNDKLEEIMMAGAIVEGKVVKEGEGEDFSTITGAAMGLQSYSNYNRLMWLLRTLGIQQTDSDDGSDSGATAPTRVDNHIDCSAAPPPCAPSSKTQQQQGPTSSTPKSPSPHAAAAALTPLQRAWDKLADTTLHLSTYTTLLSGYKHKQESRLLCSARGIWADGDVEIIEKSGGGEEDEDGLSTSSWSCASNQIPPLSKEELKKLDEDASRRIQNTTTSEQTTTTLLQSLHANIQRETKLSILARKYHNTNSGILSEMSRRLPALVPVLLIGLAGLLSTLVIILVAFAVASLEDVPSHKVVMFVYPTPTGGGGAVQGGCPSSSGEMYSLDVQLPVQTWDAPATDRCVPSRILGLTTPFSSPKYIRAKCEFDKSSSTSRVRVSIGETESRCESNPSIWLENVLSPTSSFSGSLSSCVPSSSLLSTPTISSSPLYYLSGICAPLETANIAFKNALLVGGSRWRGGGDVVAVPLTSTSYNPTTDKYIGDDESMMMRVKMGAGNDIIEMGAFGALKVIGLSSPSWGDAGQTAATTATPPSALYNQTIPLLHSSLYYPRSSGEHLFYTSSKDDAALSSIPLSAMSARGFAFQRSNRRNGEVINMSSILLSSSSTAATAASSPPPPPLTPSPLRYTGIDASSMFNLGVADDKSQYTINFWIKAQPSTKGFIFATANDWHHLHHHEQNSTGGDSSSDDYSGSSNIILDALSHMLGLDGDVAQQYFYPTSPHYQFYSALILDGPSRLLSLKFGGNNNDGGGGGSGVTWDLSSTLHGGDDDDILLLDGMWHMVSITSDVTAGWRSFHLAVDLQTSYTDSNWHKCAPRARTSISIPSSSSSSGSSSSAVYAHQSIANISRIQREATATTAVAYVGYGFGGGAAIAAFQVITDKSLSPKQLRVLGTTNMVSTDLTSSLVIGIALFGIVAISAIVAVCQIRYRAHVEEAKIIAFKSLNNDEQEKLTLVAKARARKAGKSAAKAIASASGDISKIYSSVRQMSVNVGTGTAVGQLKTIFPQFIAVCQAMAIYLTSWTWPSEFSEFASRMSFIFAFKFDLQFDAIPTIAMPIAQIILAGTLLVFAVLLTLYDQKQFYIAALGLRPSIISKLKADQVGDFGDDGDDDDEKIEDASHLPSSSSSPHKQQQQPHHDQQKQELPYSAILEHIPSSRNSNNTASGMSATSALSMGNNIVTPPQNVDTIQRLSATGNSYNGFDSSTTTEKLTPWGKELMRVGALPLNKYYNTFDLTQGDERSIDFEGTVRAGVARFAASSNNKDHSDNNGTTNVADDEDASNSSISRTLTIRPHTCFRLLPWSSTTQEHYTPSSRRKYISEQKIYTFGLSCSSGAERSYGTFSRVGRTPEEMVTPPGTSAFVATEGIVYSPVFYRDFKVQISKLLATCINNDAETLRRDYTKGVEFKTSGGNKQRLEIPVEVVVGTQSQTTHSHPNWQESSIPCQVLGVDLTSLATEDFTLFKFYLDKAAKSAGLEVVSGYIIFERNVTNQEYEFYFVRKLQTSLFLTQSSTTTPTNTTLTYTGGKESSIKTTIIPPSATIRNENCKLVLNPISDHISPYLCPRHQCHLIPYNGRFHKECTTCSNTLHDDCRSYLKFNKRKCTKQISFVCVEETCGYCLCNGGCAGGTPFWTTVMRRLHGYNYTFWHSNINYIIGFFILILGQSLFLPVVQSAAMIATCHVDFQCDFPRCYKQISIKYGVSLYFAFITIVVCLGVMIPFFSVMIMKRKFFLLEHGIVPCVDHYSSMSFWSRLLAEIDEEDWNMFLLRDNSVLRVLYEMYEFRYVAIHGVFLFFKVLLLVPVVVLERDSTQQLLVAGIVELLMLLFLTVTDAYINPWMDALARIGSFHQVLQLGLVAMSRAYIAQEVMLGYVMIGVSVAYIIALFIVVFHEIILPFMRARWAAQEAETLRRTRASVAFWVDLAFMALSSDSRCVAVFPSDYFTTTTTKSSLSDEEVEDGEPAYLLRGLDAAYNDTHHTNHTSSSSIAEAHEFIQNERRLFRKLCSSRASPSPPQPSSSPNTHRNQHHHQQLQKIDVTFAQCINKAITLLPSDPYVYTIIAQKLTLNEVGYRDRVRQQERTRELAEKATAEAALRIKRGLTKKLRPTIAMRQQQQFNNSNSDSSDSGFNTSSSSSSLHYEDNDDDSDVDIDNKDGDFSDDEDANDDDDASTKPPPLPPKPPGLVAPSFTLTVDYKRAPHRSSNKRKKKKDREEIEEDGGDDKNKSEEKVPATTSTSKNNNNNSVEDNHDDDDDDSAAVGKTAPALRPPLYFVPMTHVYNHQSILRHIHCPQLGENNTIRDTVPDYEIEQRDGVDDGDGRGRGGGGVNSSSSYILVCPAIFLLNWCPVHERPTVVEILRHALELDRTNASRYLELAAIILKYQLPDSTVVVHGVPYTPAGLLACAVEREPDNLRLTEVLVRHLLNLMDLNILHTNNHKSENVFILGIEMDVLQLCEEFVHRRPESVEGYLLLCWTMMRCQELSIIFEDPEVLIRRSRQNTYKRFIINSNAKENQNKIVSERDEDWEDPRHQEEEEEKCEGNNNNNTSPPSSSRPVRLHGRTVYHAKSVLLFVIEVMRVLDSRVFVALAEALVAEENRDIISVEEGEEGFPDTTQHHHHNANDDHLDDHDEQEEDPPNDELVDGGDDNTNNVQPGGQQEEDDEEEEFDDYCIPGSDDDDDNNEAGNHNNKSENIEDDNDDFNDDDIPNSDDEGGGVCEDDGEGIDQDDEAMMFHVPHVPEEIIMEVSMDNLGDGGTTTTAILNSSNPPSSSKDMQSPRLEEVVQMVTTTPATATTTLPTTMTTKPSLTTTTTTTTNQSGIVTLFGRRCSSIDVLGIAHISHPHDDLAIFALLRNMSRVGQVLLQKAADVEDFNNNEDDGGNDDDDVGGEDYDGEEEDHEVDDDDDQGGDEYDEDEYDDYDDEVVFDGDGGKWGAYRISDVVATGIGRITTTIPETRNTTNDLLSSSQTTKTHHPTTNPLSPNTSIINEQAVNYHTTTTTSAPTYPSSPSSASWVLEGLQVVDSLEVLSRYFFDHLGITQNNSTADGGGGNQHGNVTNHNDNNSRADTITSLLGLLEVAMKNRRKVPTMKAECWDFIIPCSIPRNEAQIQRLQKMGLLLEHNTTTSTTTSTTTTASGPGEPLTSTPHNQDHHPPHHLNRWCLVELVEFAIARYPSNIPLYHTLWSLVVDIEDTSTNNANNPSSSNKKKDLSSSSPSVVPLCVLPLSHARRSVASSTEEVVSSASGGGKLAAKRGGADDINDTSNQNPARLDVGSSGTQEEVVGNFVILPATLMHTIMVEHDWKNLDALNQLAYRHFPKMVKVSEAADLVELKRMTMLYVPHEAVRIVPQHCIKKIIAINHHHRTNDEDKKDEVKMPPTPSTHHPPTTKMSSPQHPSPSSPSVLLIAVNDVDLALMSLKLASLSSYEHIVLAETMQKKEAIRLRVFKRWLRKGMVSSSSSSSSALSTLRSHFEDSTTTTHNDQPDHDNDDVANGGVLYQVQVNLPPSPQSQGGAGRDDDAMTTTGDNNSFNNDDAGGGNVPVIGKHCNTYNYNNSTSSEMIATYLDIPDVLTFALDILNGNATAIRTRLVTDHNERMVGLLTSLKPLLDEIIRIVTNKNENLKRKGVASGATSASSDVSDKEGTSFHASLTSGLEGSAMSENNLLVDDEEMGGGGGGVYDDGKGGGQDSSKHYHDTSSPSRQIQQPPHTSSELDGVDDNTTTNDDDDVFVILLQVLYGRVSNWFPTSSSYLSTIVSSLARGTYMLTKASEELAATRTSVQLEFHHLAQAVQQAFSSHPSPSTPSSSPTLSSTSTTTTVIAEIHKRLCFTKMIVMYAAFKENERRFAFTLRGHFPQGHGAGYHTFLPAVIGGGGGGAIRTSWTSMTASPFLENSRRYLEDRDREYTITSIENFLNGDNEAHENSALFVPLHRNNNNQQQQQQFQQQGGNDMMLAALAEVGGGEDHDTMTALLKKNAPPPPWLSKRLDDSISGCFSVYRIPFVVNVNNCSDAERRFIVDVVPYVRLRDGAVVKRDFATTTTTLSSTSPPPRHRPLSMSGRTEKGDVVSSIEIDGDSHHTGGMMTATTTTTINMSSKLHHSGDQEEGAGEENDIIVADEDSCCRRSSIKMVEFLASATELRDFMDNIEYRYTKDTHYYEDADDDDEAGCC